MSRNPNRARSWVGAITVTAAVTFWVAGCADGDTPTSPEPSGDRQQQVAERGSSVMPFDLDRTTHHFVKTADGGVQTVVADDRRDIRQIDLIQQHLRHEADRFRRGDFTDPASIHGGQMPGIGVLRDSAGRVTIEYEKTGDGARITYTTGEAAIVTALHAWFDAQVSDHGVHATPGAPSTTTPPPGAAGAR